MNLGPYNPFRQLEAMRREIDHFFHNYMNSVYNPSETAFGFAQVDIHETEKEIVAACNLPGIQNKEDIRIEVNNHLLTVSGVVQKSNEIKGNQFYRNERYYGRFERAVMLPASANGEGVKATYRNGVLEIHIPKQQDETGKRIDVDFM